MFQNKEKDNITKLSKPWLFIYIFVLLVDYFFTKLIPAVGGAVGALGSWRGGIGAPVEVNPKPRPLWVWVIALARSYSCSYVEKKKNEISDDEALIPLSCFCPNLDIILILINKKISKIITNPFIETMKVFKWI